jgi:STE24 endopeptidase
VRLRQTLETSIFGMVPQGYGVLMAFVAVLVLGSAVLFLPLAYYGGFVLPHRFQLSVQTQRSWAADYVKGTLLGLVQAVVVAVPVYALLRTTPTWWWLWAAGLVVLFGVVLANLAPVLILPIFYKLSPLEDEALRQRLEGLARAAGTRVRGVWVMDMSRRTRAANAMLMGIGNTRRIVLGDTLLRTFEPHEVETVLAHELGHHVHRDLWRAIALDGVTVLLALWLIDRLAGALSGALGLQGMADVAALPLWLLIGGAVVVLALPVTNGFSRRREAAADRFAVRATGNAAAWKAALSKLAEQNLAEVDPPPWVEWLLYSHPSIRHRLEAADRVAGGE